MGNLQIKKQGALQQCVKRVLFTLARIGDHVLSTILLGSNAQCPRLCWLCWRAGLCPRGRRQGALGKGKSGREKGAVGGSGLNRPEAVGTSLIIG